MSSQRASQGERAAWCSEVCGSNGLRIADLAGTQADPRRLEQRFRSTTDEWHRQEPKAWAPGPSVLPKRWDAPERQRDPIPQAAIEPCPGAVFLPPPAERRA